MKFRPCIDIHNGSVKQIVGGSLSDKGNFATNNFVSNYDGEYYGRLYKDYNLKGGHIIILNSKDSEFYNADLEQAFKALSAFPGGLQIGGGITDENATDFLNKGADGVIVTSFVFKDGAINYDNLKKIVKKIGKENLILDLSCKQKNNDYYIVTDRWQKFTETKLNEKTFEILSNYCREFLVHAVDCEGKQKGIQKAVAEIIATHCNNPCTYAGGISSLNDLNTLKMLGKGKIDFTVGSALDIFGGNMKFEDVVNFGR